MLESSRDMVDSRFNMELDSTTGSSADVVRAASSRVRTATVPTSMAYPVHLATFMLPQPEYQIAKRKSATPSPTMAPRVAVSHRVSRLARAANVQNALSAG